MRKLCDRSPPARAVMFLAVVGCAVLMTATSASAVMIDDFSDGGFSISVQDGYVGPPPPDRLPQVATDDQDSLTNVLGGRRRVTLTWQQGDGSSVKDITATVEESVARLGFDADSGDPDYKGTLLVEYLGGSAAAAASKDDVDADLTDGGTWSGIGLYSLSSDGTADVTLTLTDMSSNTFSVTFVDVDSPGMIFWDFDDFTGVDETHIGFVSLLIQGDLIGDYSYSSLESAIPEPLTMLGMFAGIAGIGGYLRKRRRA